MKHAIFLWSLLVSANSLAAEPAQAISRNLVNTSVKGLPLTWDTSSGENIRWSVDLGSQTYGNPVVAGGKVLVGTNNAGKRDAAVTDDKGVMLCFSEKDGSFLWQAIHDKLPSGGKNDWPLQGVASTPWVDGDRAYYVSNRCELVCVDMEGFADGENDGFQGETLKGPQHADIVWTYDMIKEQQVYPHNLANCSPLVVGDLVYLITGNGVDDSHRKLPSPDAPAFMAINKQSGALAWKASTLMPVLHGQWASPAAGMVQGKMQIIFPGGDGQIYGFSPDGKQLWVFDGSEKDAKWEPGGSGKRNSIISTPVILNGQVYIGVGDDPDFGSGPGGLYRIDAAGQGDISITGRKWKLGDEDFHRTLSTVAVDNGLLYTCDLDGIFYCIDVETGKIVWKHDLFAAVWGSPLVVDGKVYIGDEDGDICILALGRELKILGEANVGDAIYTTPSAAHGTLFVTSNTKLLAIGTK